MAGPCSKNFFRPKPQDSTKMGIRRPTQKKTANRDVAKIINKEKEHRRFNIWREVEGVGYQLIVQFSTRREGKEDESVAGLTSISH